MSETEKTVKKVKSFIKNNPYPKYEEIIETLNSIARAVPIDNLKQEVFNMISEYGRENHKWMKEIYENIMDEEVIKENGKKINNRGGKVAMVENYYVIVNILGDKTDKLKMKHDEVVEILYPIKTQISECWHGIGDWKH